MNKYKKFVSIFLISNSVLALISSSQAQDLFQYQGQVVKPSNPSKSETIIINKSDNTDNGIVITDNSSKILKPVPEEDNTKTENDGDVIFVQEEKPHPTFDNWPTIVQAMKPDYQDIDNQIANGKNVNKPIVETNNLLMLGAMQNDANKVNIALKYNANVTIPNKQGATPLHWAAGKSSYEIVTSILLAGNTNSKALNSLINAQDKNGRTPLHYAALYAYNNLTTQLLLKNNADYNITDTDGRTPAHYAAASGHWDTLESLMKNGSVLTLKDKNDMSVEDILLEKADVDHMIKFYHYFSNEGQLKLKAKLKNLTPSADINSTTTIKDKNNEHITVIPPLKMRNK